MSSLHIMLLFPFAFAAVIPFLYKKLNPRVHIGWFVAIVSCILFVYFLQYLPIVLSEETIQYTIPWVPSLNIDMTLHVTGLGLLFTLLITGIGTLVSIYSVFYMSKTRDALGNFYVYLLLFMGAMLGLVLSDNILVFYGFWELTSVSSFLLIAFWYERKASRYGALKALNITVFGGLAMLGGFLVIANAANTFSLQKMIRHSEIIQADPLFIPAMLLILLGAFTKSAQFPFSIWLPDAMEAPTPVSAYLHSATMVKAGLFLVASFTPIFGGHALWFWLLIGIGLMTLLYGSVRAVRQTDLKALLAYSTISQLGLMMSLLGIGSAALYQGGAEGKTAYVLALFAAIFHLFNHSTFKGSLFMVIGIIDHEAGTRDIRRLGGLMKIMPATFLLGFVAALSMAGLPPFNGFLSKEMFFKGTIDILGFQGFHVDKFGIIIPIVAWIASVFTFIYSLILLIKTFFGSFHPERLPKKNVHEAPIGMLIPPIILGTIVLLVFFFPNVLAKSLLIPALATILPGTDLAEVDIHIAPWHGWTAEFWMTIGVVAVGIILYMLIPRWNRVWRVYPEKLSLNHLYNGFLEKMELYSVRTTNRYMTGSLRTYLIYMLLFFIVVAIVGLITNVDQFEVASNHAITIYDIGLVVAVALAAFTVVITNNRITAIVALGGVGFLVVMLFVIFRAPDLALTQMVVESVTTVLFLLCFYHMPKMSKRMEKRHFKSINVIIAASVGLLATLLTLLVIGNRSFEPITSFFENAYELAGAKNIVNAILVDFRGFDTMLEISVLLIAGLGVYTLIKLRGDKGRDTGETK